MQLCTLRSIPITGPHEILHEVVVGFSGLGSGQRQRILDLGNQLEASTKRGCFHVAVYTYLGGHMSSAFLKKLNFEVAFDCKTPKATCAQPSATFDQGFDFGQVPTAYIQK